MDLKGFLNSLSENKLHQILKRDKKEKKQEGDHHRIHIDYCSRVVFNEAIIVQFK